MILQFCLEAWEQSASMDLTTSNPLLCGCMYRSPTKEVDDTKKNDRRGQKSAQRDVEIKKAYPDMRWLQLPRNWLRKWVRTRCKKNRNAVYWSSAGKPSSPTHLQTNTVSYWEWAISIRSHIHNRKDGQGAALEAWIRRKWPTTNVSTSH